MTRLLIIDDHPLVSEGIAMMLRDISYLHVAGTCKTGKEALAFLDTISPDIILLDISLPDINGIELCSMIRQQNKTVKIIGLTSANDTGIITQFLSKGGNGYLLKNMERDELLTAVTEVTAGKTYLSKEANEKLLQQFHSLHDAMKRMPVLTRREKEILLLLYQGFTGPQIAEKLFLSPYTIETHRKNLMQKFGTNNTQQLLRMAMDNKLI